MTHACARSPSSLAVAYLACVDFCFLLRVFVVASWKEVLDMKDKTVVRVQQEWSSKVAARTEGKEAAAATTATANSATSVATK